MKKSYVYDEVIAMNCITLNWNATNLCVLIYSKNLAPELQCLNLAVVLLRLAWNISGMRESELSNHELLDVLSEVVLKLSGRETWNSSHTLQHTVQTMFEMVFHQRCEVVVNTLRGTLLLRIVYG